MNAWDGTSTEGCSSGKVAFRNGFEARQAIAERRRRKRGRQHHKHKSTMRAYECRECGKWHLSSSRSRPKH